MNITVIGLGLIGGSMALELKQKGFCNYVIGVDNNKEHSERALELKIIDEIIPEPLGGAHRDKNLILNNVRRSISKNLNLFKEMSVEEISDQRKNKFLKIGRDKGFISNPESLSALESKNSFQELFKNQ